MIKATARFTLIVLALASACVIMILGADLLPEDKPTDINEARHECVRQLGEDCPL